MGPSHPLVPQPVVVGGNFRRRRVAVAAVVFVGALVYLGRAASGSNSFVMLDPPPLPSADEPFLPSNAQTADGELIPSSHFFPARRCAGCHADTHEAWSESLHRNAAREPFYKESVDILERTRSIEFTRHCESCHAPISLVSGALTTGSRESRAMDDEGVTCTVCHSITSVRNDGTGSYTIRRPALLVDEHGRAATGDVTDEEILADVPGHRRAMMSPVLETPEFCGTCHKSVAPPSLNGYKPLKGFSAYDEWQQSGMSHEAVGPYYRRPERADCRTCHMPPMDAHEDAAATDGKVASNRWLGANTAAPLFYGQKTQVALTEKFLQDGVLNVDIFRVTNEALSATIAPVPRASESHVAVPPDWAGAAVTVDVVVANRKAGHSFPPELRDLYEAWVELEVTDRLGTPVFRSGHLLPDGTLDPSAHVYRSVLLDAQGRPVTRHEMWLVAAKAYDNAIPPGRSDLVRFRFRWPSSARSRLTITARVNYRRFNQDYARFVLERQKSRLEIPVVRMAETRVSLTGDGPSPTPPPAPGDARRWNDYGIALVDQAQYGAAADAFRQAARLDPADPNLAVNIALAEMRTERFGPEKEQWRKAETLLEQALQMRPGHDRARFFRALVWRGLDRSQHALAELQELATRYPRDRELQRQLGLTAYATDDRVRALNAFEALLAIDPNDAGAHQFLAPLLGAAGRHHEAATARTAYLAWRDDPLAEQVPLRFFAAHPEWADERIGAHVHAEGSPERAVIAEPGSRRTADLTTHPRTERR